MAAGPRTAYVNNPDAFGQTFVTHDDGRSWERIAPPCPRESFGRLASDGSSGSVWVTCADRHGVTRWRARPTAGAAGRRSPVILANVFHLQPVSAQVAWRASPQGFVVHTTDGALAWSTVWSVGASQPASLRSHAPRLAALASDTPMTTAQSATSASVVMILTRGHVGEQARFTKLVAYRTSDSGATWYPSVLRLPEH